MRPAPRRIRPRMQFPDYPFAPQRFEVRPGIAMSYLDEGPRDGEVIVMLHGNPSWSFYWRHLVNGLKDRYRCIVPDHVGMGLSDRPDDAASASPRSIAISTFSINSSRGGGSSAGTASHQAPSSCWPATVMA